MKIVFVSNYYNHHHFDLSYQFSKNTQGNYYFIQTEPMEDERRDLGWGGIELPAFVKKSYENEETFRECIQLINDADAVLVGSAPNTIIKQRLKERKLVFRYAERPYKNWKNIITLPLRFVKYHTYNYFSKNVYLLSASAYAASDYAKTLNYIGKAYKWGYFPSIKEYEDIDKLIANKKKNYLLWVARFIDWKHPEIPVGIAKRLKEDGYSFELDMIGSGSMLEEIKELVKKEDLEEYVHILGPMSPEKVREHMEKSEIFLFTSDRNEGWGAVLNESMNSACAVVANKAIGAVPYLIKEGENGFTYKNGNIDELYQNVKRLLDDSELRKRMSFEAYRTMIETWNAKVAVERFLNLVEGIKNGKNVPYSDGPCSKA